MTLEDYKRINTRKASILTLGGSRPSGSLFTTHFGLKPLHLPGEPWPFYNNMPLFFVCQLNLSECPYIPDLLHGIVLITFFTGDLNISSVENESGRDWVLRTYPTLNGLTPMDIPQGRTLKKGFEGKWEIIDDHPVYDDPDIIVPTGFERGDNQLDNSHRTKMGGYPSNIQSEQWWSGGGHPADPKFCFQIDSESKVGLEWGDKGTLYFARGTAPGSENKWYRDWQWY